MFILILIQKIFGSVTGELEGARPPRLDIAVLKFALDIDQKNY